MNATQNKRIEAWKTNSALRRKALSERLAAKTASPYWLSVWTPYLKGVERWANNRQSLAEAYAAHMQAVSHTISSILAGGGSTSSGTKKTGSLGE